MAQKIIKIGSSVGVVLPKETLDEMNTKVGDTIEVIANKNKREYIIKVGDKNKLSKADLRVAELTANFIDRYRGDLENLAK